MLYLASVTIPQLMVDGWVQLTPFIMSSFPAYWRRRVRSLLTSERKFWAIFKSNKVYTFSSERWSLYNFITTSQVPPRSLAHHQQCCWHYPAPVKDFSRDLIKAAGAFWQRRKTWRMEKELASRARDEVRGNDFLVKSDTWCATRQPQPHILTTLLLCQSCHRQR